ncbi:E3 ubiquitin-protein ligase MARCHF1 [Taenia solium]|eukprot:TsM_000179600 transcript=TsM_000179600 gene=TsM_000179600
MSRRTLKKQRVGSLRSICASVTPLCRICCESNESTIERDLECCGRLIAPCLCDGSMEYVHQWCIQHWIGVSRSRKFWCEFTKTSPRAKYVYLVREPSKRRIERLRRTAMAGDWGEKLPSAGHF